MAQRPKLKVRAITVKRIVISTLSVCCIIACQPVSEPRNEKPAFENQLPQITVSDATCPPPPDSLAPVDRFCVHYLSADVLVFGRVKSIKAAVAPAYTSAQGHPLTEDCASIEGFLSPALELELESEDILVGSLPSPTFKVRIPWSVVSKWLPFPTVSEDGLLAWADYDGFVNHGLGVGMTLGMTLWYDAAIGQYTTLWTSLMEIKDGELHRQNGISTGECEVDPAVQARLASKDLETFSGHIAACDVPTDIVDGQNEYMAGEIIARPHDAHGARCGLRIGDSE